MNMEEHFRYDFSGNWYKGNLHMHTSCSDGRLTVEEAAAFYAEQGYDFIAVTDHMTPFKAPEQSNGFPILILEGVELGGKDDRDSFYHVVCIGNVDGISSDMTLMEAMRKAESQDSIIIWAHPHWSSNTAADGLHHGFLGMEVYNHSVEMPIGKGNGAYHWDMVLEQQPNMLGFATDDNHFFEGFPDQVGGWIMVNAPELTPGAIMTSIRKGNFYSSCGPEYKSIHIEQGNRVVAETSPIIHSRLIGPGTQGKWKADIDKKPMERTNFRIPDDWAFARLEIEDANGKKAWSNPLLDVKG